MKKFTKAVREMIRLVGYFLFEITNVSMRVFLPVHSILIIENKRPCRTRRVPNNEVTPPRVLQEEGCGMGAIRRFPAFAKQIIVAAIPSSKRSAPFPPQQAI